MKTQHTKGEWKRKPYIGTTKESPPLRPVYYNNVCSTSGIGGRIMAKCLSLNKDELIANAKLIAAAPELLELAYEMRIVMGHLTGRMGEQMEIEVNNQIDSAINKATS